MCRRRFRGWWLRRGIAHVPWCVGWLTCPIWDTCCWPGSCCGGGLVRPACPGVVAAAEDGGCRWDWGAEFRPPESLSLPGHAGNTPTEHCASWERSTCQRVSVRVVTLWSCDGMGVPRANTGSRATQGPGAPASWSLPHVGLRSSFLHGRLRLLVCGWSAIRSAARTAVRATVPESPRRWRRYRLSWDGRRRLYMCQ